MNLLYQRYNVPFGDRSKPRNQEPNMFQLLKWNAEPSNSKKEQNLFV